MTNPNPPVQGGIAPHLSVGNAGKAAEFYRKAFGAKWSVATTMTKN